MEDDAQPVKPFTLGEAARQARVSKPTISKAIKDGRLTAEKMPDGSYSIQPAELFRVYPPDSHLTGSSNPHVGASATVNLDRLVTDELLQLRERLTIFVGERDRERRQLSDQIEDLRRRLDAEAAARALDAEERRKLTAVLTDQRTPKPKPEPEAEPAQAFPATSEAAPAPLEPLRRPKGLRGLLRRMTG